MFLPMSPPLLLDRFYHTSTITPIVHPSSHPMASYSVKRTDVANITIRPGTQLLLSIAIATVKECSNVVCRKIRFSDNNNNNNPHQERRTYHNYNCHYFSDGTYVCMYYYNKYLLYYTTK